METAKSLQDLQARPVEGGAILRACTLLQALLAMVGFAVLVAAAHPGAREALLSASREAVITQTSLALRATVPPGVNFAAGPIQPPVLTQREREQRAVTEMLAKRFRVAQEAVGGFVAAAYRIGKDTSVDPLLILAVICVESRFNPVAESNFGAKGLMQVIPKFHKEKLVGHGGDDALLDPEINILVGAQVLREYMKRFGGTESALQAYAGAYEEPTAMYSKQVLSERSRIEQTVQTVAKVRPRAI
jgi:soluble lytic murein transglycosylase-like protein